MHLPARLLARAGCMRRPARTRRLLRSCRASGCPGRVLRVPHVRRGRGPRRRGPLHAGRDRGAFGAALPAAGQPRGHGRGPHRLRAPGCRLSSRIVYGRGRLPRAPIVSSRRALDWPQLPFGRRAGSARPRRRPWRLVGPRPGQQRWSRLFGPVPVTGELAASLRPLSRRPRRGACVHFHLSPRSGRLAGLRVCSGPDRAGGAGSDSTRGGRDGERRSGRAGGHRPSLVPRPRGTRGARRSHPHRGPPGPGWRKLDRGSADRRVLRCRFPMTLASRATSFRLARNSRS